jgi:glycogen operon protein
VSGPTGLPLYSFDPQKVLLDPYSKCIFFPSEFDRKLAMREGSNAGRAPLGVLAAAPGSFDWEGDRHPRPEPETII